MKKFISIFCIVLTLAAGGSTYGQGTIKSIGINEAKTTMLVFPANIIDVDKGTDDISIRVNKKTPSVLKVKATEGVFGATNLTVYTEDGRMYVSTIYYDSLAGNQPVIFSATENGLSVLPTEGTPSAFSMQQIKNMAAVLTRFPRRLHHPSAKSGGQVICLSNIWYKNEYLFFQFTFRNTSEIPYDLDFMKYYIRDNKRAKRTSVTEQEISPVFTYYYPASRTHPYTSSVVLVVFKKFAIADTKHLTVQFFEQNGDRHLTLDIGGKKLLRTRLLP